MNPTSSPHTTSARLPLISIRSVCESIFKIDLRALAIFRISIGTVLVYDLLTRLPDLGMFYTDRGVLPRGLAIKLFGDKLVGLSLNLISGDLWFQVFLWATALVSAIALLVGYKTRTANVVSWILLISLCSRNTKVLNGGDNLLWMLLFWSMFLPLGERYSVDAKRSMKNKAAAKSFVASFGSAGILMQVVLMYVMTAYLKTGQDWKDGTALYYALSVELYCRPFAQVLLRYPDFLKIMTHGTMFIERFGPVLLLLPSRLWGIKLAGVLGFVMLHSGISSVMRLGIFPLVDVVALIPFVPAPVWNFIESKYFEKGTDVRSKAKPNQQIAYKTHPIVNWVAGFFVAYMVWWGAGVFNKDWTMPRSLQPMAYSLKLYQNWKMFAPSPSRYDGWFVTVGILDDGREIDLFRRGGDIRWDKPKDVSGEFETMRQKNYMCQMLSYKYPKELLKKYCDYLYLKWQKKLKSSNRKLKEIKFYFVEERTLPNQARAPVKKRLLWQSKYSA